MAGAEPYAALERSKTALVVAHSVRGSVMEYATFPSTAQRPDLMVVTALAEGAASVEMGL